MDLQTLEGLGIYWAIVGLMMTGLYALIARENLVKKVMGLSMFQSSAILFYVTMAKVRGGTAPILIEDGHPGAEGHAAGAAGATAHAAAETAVTLYSNPLPHVLMLTAIVVGVATLALALALVVRIQDRYGTVEEDDIEQLDLREGSVRAAEPVVSGGRR